MDAAGRRVGLVPKTDLDDLQASYDALLTELKGAYALLTDYQRGWPPGHFYSPIPALEDIAAREEQIFRKPRALPGIDLNEAGQLELLEKLGQFHSDQPFPEQQSDTLRFFADNPNYRYGEALTLYGMLRLLRPRRVIEVGSGYSSCVILDTRDHHFEGKIDCTFIEPYPELLMSLIRPGDIETVRLIGESVQNVGSEVFGELQAGDILLIDSTHVGKAGSDVNDLIFRVLPALNPGVYIQVHDIYYPFQYPREWVFEGRAWNEAYVLRAFLQYNAAFSIVLYNQYLATFHRDALAAALPLAAKNPGSSIWLRKEGTRT